MNKSLRSSRDNPYLQFGRKKILQILQEVEEGLNRKEACEKYGMAYGTLAEWLRQYGSDTYQAQKRRSFPVHQKRSIVQSVVSGRMTKKEACIAFKLNKNVLNSWILKFQLNSEAPGKDHYVMPKTTTTASPLKPDDLQLAILKIEALETMIDIAEQEFKISIRKKSGAKQ